MFGLRNGSDITMFEQWKNKDKIENKIIYETK